MKVERDNWRVYAPRPLMTVLGVLAYVVVQASFRLVDLVDPRDP